MSEYNQSQPLVMSSIKIGSYVLTEAELNKFVKLDSFRKIPSEYIGCDIRVNVYTLTEYAALQWIPHPSMGDVAIVFDPDENKACYNGTYVYQNPDIGNCVPPHPCDVPPPAETRVINIANWKLVNPTITYDDIVKWNHYTEELGIVRQDIVTLRELIGQTEASINALTDNKIAMAKVELTTDFKSNDNDVRNEFAAADDILKANIDSVEDKFDGEVNRIDQVIIDVKAKHAEDDADLQNQISENKENIRLNARDLGDLNVKFDRTVEAINTSVDQKVTLLKEEVASKISQHTSEIDGKLTGQDTKFTAADESLNTRITNEVSGLNDRVDSEVDTLNNKIETADNTLNNKIDEEKTSRISNDQILDTRITTEVASLNSKLNTAVDELNNRVDGDVEALTNSINNEKNVRETSDQNLNARITNEVSDLENRIDGVETNYKAADESLNTRITNEVSGLNDRVDSEVDTLDNKIDSEVDALTTKIETADNTLRVAQETGDQTLDTRITNVSAEIRTELNTAKSELSNNIKTNVTNLTNVINTKESELTTLIEKNDNDINYAFDQHTNDTNVHVTAAKQADWNAKVSQAELATGLAGKANVVDVYDKVAVDNKFDEVNAYIQAKYREHFQGFFASTAELPLPGQQGWYAVCGTTDTIWIWDVESAAWIDSKAKSAVTSVNDKSGVVVLTKADVGLGSVDNTSDADKPISTAVANALGGKVDKIEGKGLSANDYTDEAVAEVAKVALKANQKDVTTALNLKADKEYVDNLNSTKFFIGVFTSVDDLPLDATPGQFAVVTNDDLIYIWDQGKHGWISGLDKSYTKEEVDDIVSVKADATYVDQNIQETTATLATKANVVDVDNKLATKAGVEYVDSKFADVDNKLVTKADKTYVDSKFADVDSVFDSILVHKKFVGVFDTNSNIPAGTPGDFAVTTEDDKFWVWDGNSADWITYYTTSEIDSKLAVKANAVDVDQSIQNVLTAVSVKSDKTYVDGELAKKVDAELYTTDYQNINSELNRLSNDKVNVDIYTTEIGLKANKTYVDEQVALLTKFRGYFETDVEITGIDNPKNGDYAVCNATGTVWYYKVDNNGNGTWIDGDVHGEVTLEQFERELALKAVAEDVYTKTESDSKFATINKVGELEGQLNAKAIADQVYTKTVADGLFVTQTNYNTFVGETRATLDEKANETSVAQRFADINGRADALENAKVDKVEGKELSDNNYDDAAVAEVAKVVDKADKVYVDDIKTSLGSQSDVADVAGTAYARIANLVEVKANKSDVDSAMLLKANAADVNSALALKADKTYVESTYVPTSTFTTEINKKADATTVENLASSLSNKADASAISSITSELANKVSTDTYNSFVGNVYSKSEADAKYLTISTASSTYATISNVGVAGDAANATGSAFARIAECMRLLAAYETRIAELEAKVQALENANQP